MQTLFIWVEMSRAGGSELVVWASAGWGGPEVMCSFACIFVFVRFLRAKQPPPWPSHPVGQVYLCSAHAV